MPVTEERWLPVPGFEGAYEVSDLGRVRSLDHYVDVATRWGGTAKRFQRGRVLSSGKGTDYPSVNLFVDGQVTHRRTHVLVAAAFLGPRPHGQEVCHKNGDKQDCRAVNLRYGTPVSNTADKYEHGTHLQGEDCPWAKLAEGDVREIRRLRGQHTRDDLGLMFGISGSLVTRIQ
jgi:hypothetical protein